MNSNCFTLILTPAKIAITFFDQQRSFRFTINVILNKLRELVTPFPSEKM
jgi:hypothetical protein